MRCGRSAAAPRRARLFSSYASKLPSYQTTCESPSKASTWVATRSRNQRSCEMITAQQQVAAAPQQLRQLHAVALAARQRAPLALLVRAAEVEAGRVGARVHLALADLDLVVAVRDLLPGRLVGIERVARLVHVGRLHRL